MNHIEVMKRMIGSFQEVLAYCDEQGHTWACLAQAKAEIEAGRQAIAEAEKQEQGEPVAWIFKPNLELLWPHEVERKNPLELNEYAPLYTHPQPAPVQEPVAYRSRLASGSYTYCNTPQFFDNAEPLFTTPPAAQPKREWIGLTDEEAGKCRKGTWQATFQAIDTLLREKNGGKA